ncbi:MAG: hypothetical protein JST51_11780 [Armatimonadetes bacterium]|nr:hypothetical protein [Armatimonadota bacterium]
MSLAGSRSMLRSRVDHSLFTWKVPYGSGSKVAIAALPPISGGQNVVVRELKVDQNDRLTIDRCLELYLDVLPSQAQKDAGLRRVPLHLLVASDGAVWSDGTLQTMCEELLRQTLGNAHDAFSADQNLVRVTQVPRAKLETFVCYNDMSAEAETVVAMVDEYWVNKPIRRNELESRFLPIQYRKLQERVHIQYDRQLVKGTRNGSKGEKVDKETQLVDGLVPFTWNFGLMMIRRNPWQQLEGSWNKKDDSVYEGQKSPRLPNRIKTIVEKLSHKIRWIEGKLDNPYEDENDADLSDRRHIRNNTLVFWHEFLHACHVVAQRYSLRYDRDPLKPYELDLTDGQSLTSLALEVWLSTGVWIRVFATESKGQRQHKNPKQFSAQGLDEQIKLYRQAIAQTLYDEKIPKDVSKTLLSKRLLKDGIKKRHLGSEFSPDRYCKAIFLEDISSRRYYTEITEEIDSESKETLKFLEEHSMAWIVDNGLKRIKQKTSVDKVTNVVEPTEQNTQAVANENVHKPSVEPNNSDDTLDRCSELVVALFLTVVILSESIDFESWELDESSHTFKGKPSLGNAVAGRYWYTSACQMLRTKTPDGQSVYDPADPFLPMGLPGVFSTRGDWHLAILRSSRSHYLGELAIDQLSRSKAVSSRMQSGLGLPPLVMTEQPDFENEADMESGKREREHAEVYRRVRTAFPSPSGGRLATFSYQYFREIAPISNPEETQRKFFGHSNCYAIHRSRIKNYLDEHNLFLKGICRLITSFEDIKRRTGWDWKDFHRVFEQLEGHELDFYERIRERESTGNLGPTGQRITGLQTWKEFSSYLEAFFPLVPHKGLDQDDGGST